MTTCDEGGPSVVFARVPGVSWPDDESDCRWCSILLGPGSAAGPAPAERALGRHPRYRATGLRTWLERARTVMLPLAAVTVVVALALAALS
ncbi:hypothetical protein ACLVWQ_05405 [Streptomyces sp. CWNU-52B]|uniref:hypothetical protein n=1 Tax=unclassified Streptomyces TaxID=2593676 RepID=UPI0039BF4C7D